MEQINSEVTKINRQSISNFCNKEDEDGISRIDKYLVFSLIWFLSCSFGSLGFISSGTFNHYWFVGIALFPLLLMLVLGYSIMFLLLLKRLR